MPPVRLVSSILKGGGDCERDMYNCSNACCDVCVFSTAARDVYVYVIFFFVFLLFLFLYFLFFSFFGSECDENLERICPFFLTIRCCFLIFFCRLCVSVR